MVVSFSPEVEERISRSAAAQGRKVDEFVEAVVTRFLEDESRFAAAVTAGEQILEAGHFLTNAQMKQRLARFLDS